ncbi:decaprenyl-phosphate phosphoribosyltransferase [Candidatus Chazhemtobacterium aquaticus]|uniref:decaprenyl-phosphate phosphoribosyltransferase n=1 Tax=Candidatus Chazhemtobacterium aquaticus TaxID=2715735 RepID=UPI00137A5A23|nr:decaprenyl-phosphate phosphoribosyltransferase [Candidatus Chazhemtobacterium aquaticus]
MGILWALFRTARPRQWIKNAALLAPVVFSGLLLVPGRLEKVVEAIVVFTLISASVYIFNDLLDIEADRKHPFKRKRPLASGELPVSLAVFAMLAGVIIGLAWAYAMNMFFFGICLTYLVVSGLLYTYWLKNIPILDVITIATGYILRVYAGAVVIDAHMNVWFLLTVISLSLFLAVGKRKSEMTLLRGSGNTAAVRETLKRYTEELLNIYTAMFATASWLSYALFTFNQPRIEFEGKVLTFLSLLPKTFLSEKWLMATIPLVVYGVMRYMQLIYEKNEGESPERILLSDKPLIITVVLWGVMVLGLLYVA